MIGCVTAGTSARCVALRVLTCFGEWASQPLAIVRFDVVDDRLIDQDLDDRAAPGSHGRVGTHNDFAISMTAAKDTTGRSIEGDRIHAKMHRCRSLGEGMSVKVETSSDSTIYSALRIHEKPHKTPPTTHLK